MKTAKLILAALLASSLLTSVTPFSLLARHTRGHTSTSKPEISMKSLGNRLYTGASFFPHYLPMMDAITPATSVNVAAWGFIVDKSDQIHQLVSLRTSPAKHLRAAAATHDYHSLRHLITDLLASEVRAALAAHSLAEITHSLHVAQLVEDLLPALQHIAATEQTEEEMENDGLEALCTAYQEIHAAGLLLHRQQNQKTHTVIGSKAAMPLHKNTIEHHR